MTSYDITDAVNKISKGDTSWLQAIIIADDIKHQCNQLSIPMVTTPRLVLIYDWLIIQYCVFSHQTA